MTNGNGNGGGTQYTPKWMNFIGGFLAVAVTLVVAVQTVIPYFYPITDTNAAMIGQQQTLFQNVFIMVISFFFGASVGTRMKDSSIDTLSSAVAQAATPNPPAKASITIPMKPENKA